MEELKYDMNVFSNDIYMSERTLQMCIYDHDAVRTGKQKKKILSKPKQDSTDSTASNFGEDP